MNRRKSIIYTITFLAICGFSGITLAQTYIEGNSYFGRNNYIEYLAGGLPLIISVPHGGYETPGEIPDRTCGTTVTDSYTLELSMELVDAIINITGRYPHIIINHLKRIKLDANRDVEEATCGDDKAEISWLEYHKFIDSAKVTVNNMFEKGLFIDLHGQSSHGERIELGYLISGSELSLSDAILNTETYENKSSIRNLINNNVNNLTFSELLRGNKSLGTMLENKGYTAVPSLLEESPSGDFFSGGYNTERHGSRSGGTIEAIQMECNREIRFDEATRYEFAGDLAVILLDYLKQHYLPNLEDFYSTGQAVDNLLSSGFSIYPNPVRDVLHIHNKIPTEVSVLNLFGQIMLTESVGAEDDIFLGNFPMGVYIIIFSSNGHIVYKGKIIVDQ